MTTYEIIFAENATDEDIQILDEGITQYTQIKMGDGRNTPLTFFLHDPAGAIVGGVHGNYGNFGWLYISSLWVAESVRGGGYGRQLMLKIEEKAIKNGCHNVYLDTFSFQAPAFYKKLGYVVFGQLEDFPVGNSRIFLRKKLVQP